MIARHCVNSKKCTVTPECILHQRGRAVIIGGNLLLGDHDLFDDLPWPHDNMVDWLAYQDGCFYQTSSLNSMEFQLSLFLVQ
jgi:hypothetical protein